jgi:hypothetical protein
MRTIVEMPQQELRDLTALSKEEHISRAEAIRRAVGQYLRAWKVAHGATDAFGLWKDRNLSGLEYEDRVREEWRCDESRHRHQHPR